MILLAAAESSSAQSNYQVVSLSSSGTIRGTAKWSGPTPKALTFPISKDAEVCDPESAKRRDLERLIVGPQGGVANTVVYLKEVSRGKAMDLPEPRRSLDQKHCRYEPHILLVPESGSLKIRSSDAVLHTVHMTGAATFNLPFPFAGQTLARVNDNRLPVRVCFWCSLVAPGEVGEGTWLFKSADRFRSASAVRTMASHAGRFVDLTPRFDLKGRFAANLSEQYAASYADSQHNYADHLAMYLPGSLPNPAFVQDQGAPMLLQALTSQPKL